MPSDFKKVIPNKPQVFKTKNKIVLQYDTDIDEMDIDNNIDVVLIYSTTMLDEICKVAYKAFVNSQN